MTEAVREATAAGVPFLGICVGLQWLFEGSTEAGGVAGLGAFPGLCERFVTDEKVPHVGWNSVRVDASSRLMREVADGAYVYYTHSYRAPVVEGTVATTLYGEAFSGAVERGNIMGGAVSSGEIECGGFAGAEEFSQLVAYMLTKRIIACLDVKGGRVVKGVNFVGLTDAGDPAELAARHARLGADEIVLLDITATHEGRGNADRYGQENRKRIVHSFHRRWRYPYRE